MRKRCCCWMIPAPGRGQAIAPTMDFPLPKRCEAAWEGKRHLMTHTKGGRCGWAWHGGGKRRHSSTRRARRAVEEWRRLPPPCSPTPPRRMSAHLLGNGKYIVVAVLASAMLSFIFTFAHSQVRHSWYSQREKL